MKLPTLLLAAAAWLAVNPLYAQNLLTNGDLEADPFNTGWVTSANVLQFGGLAPGSTKSAALVGTGQTIGQNLATTGADWFLDFYFAITNTPNRAFSLFVNRAGGADNTGAATINLRYQSGQFNAFGGGSFGGDLGLGTVNFSVDADGDGDLDDVGDTKNVYRMRLTGHGWGTPAANYDIQLSDANQTNLTRSVNGLTRYQNGSGVDGPPMAFLFNSAFGNNPGFWVDDVTFALVELPDDPNLELSLTGDLFGVLPVDSAVVTRTLTVRNTGLFEDLTLTNATVAGSDAARYTVNTTFPLTIVAGGQADIEVVFDPQTDSRRFSATLVLESNDPTTPMFNVSLTATRLVTGAQMLVNPDFEAAPFDLGWVTGTNISRFGGFASNSTNAARLVGDGQRLGQNVVCSADWHFECSFAVDAETAGVEAFSVYVSTISDIFNETTIRLRLSYVDGQFLYGGGALPDLGTLLPSVDANADGDFEDAGDSRNIYRLRITGHNWGAAGSTAHLEVSDSNSSFFDRVVPGLPVDSGGGTPSAISFDSLSGGNQGFWADDARLIIGLPAPRQPKIRSLSVEGGGFTLSWSSEPGATYRILFSTDLVNWVDNLFPAVPSQGTTTTLTDFLPGDPNGFFRIRKE